MVQFTPERRRKERSGIALKVAECVVMPSHINRIIMISMQVSHSHSGESIYQYDGHKTSCRTKDINEWIRLDRLKENSRMHQPFTKPMIIIIKANRLIFSVVSVMRIAFRIRNVASFFINFGCHFRTTNDGILHESRLEITTPPKFGGEQKTEMENNTN